jgi:hypothetical protein
VNEVVVPEELIVNPASSREARRPSELHVLIVRAQSVVVESVHVPPGFRSESRRVSVTRPGKLELP